MDRKQQSVKYLAELWIKETKRRLEREGKLDDELIFSVTPCDLDKCCFVGETDLSTYDILIDKIWIWLFRLQKVATLCGLPEDNLICNIVLDVEHEYVHKIDAQFVGKSEYPNLDKFTVETIVMIQQGRIKGETLKEAKENLKRITSK